MKRNGRKVNLVDRLSLVKQLNVIKDGLSNMDWLEQTNSFIFTNDYVFTYNDDFCMGAFIPDLELSCAIPAKEFLSLLEKLECKKVKIYLSKGKLRVICGKSKSGLIIEEQIKFPFKDFLSNKDWYDLPDNFVKSMDFVIPASAKNLSVPVLACVNISKDYCQATDGYRISRVKFNEPLHGIESILITTVSASMIIKINPTSIAVEEEWIHFKNKEGLIFSSKIFNGEFPDLDRLIFVQGIEVNFPEKLPEVIDRAYVFAKRDHFFDEEVLMELNKNEMIVKSSSDVGWFHESLEIKQNFDNSISFGVPPKLLQDILKMSESNKVKIEVTDKVIKFSNNDFIYVSTLKFYNKED